MANASNLLRRQIVARLMKPEENTRENWPTLADITANLGTIFQGLSRELESARRLRVENHLLREALTECVDSCERFLAPTLDGDLAEDEEHTRARLALTSARRLLEEPALIDARPRLLE